MSKKTLSTILADDNVEIMRQYLASPKGNANFTIDHVTLLGMAKSKEMAQLLIDKGADVHKEEYGLTPFLYQAAASRPEVMKVILNKDPTVISHKDSRGWNALHFCVTRTSKESLECVLILLNMKIDINARTNAGYTALDISMIAGDNKEYPNINGSIIKLLIDKGVNTTLHKDTVGLPRAKIVKEYLNRAARIIQTGVRRHLQEASWRPPNPNIPNNKGGKAYQNHLAKVKEAGHFQPRKSRKRKSRKSCKSRKSLKRKN